MDRLLATKSEVVGLIVRAIGRGGRGGRDVIVRKSVGEAVYSNISSIFTRFRHIAAFVLHHAIFPYPTSILPKVSPCSRGNRWIAFWLQRAKLLG